MSTSAQARKQMIVIRMPYVRTLKGRMFVGVLEALREMAKSAQVKHFFLLSQYVCHVRRCIEVCCVQQSG